MLGGRTSLPPWPKASMATVTFGGILERWKSPQGEELQTFATITTDANHQHAGIQDRMPAIIERQDWQL